MKKNFFITCVATLFLCYSCTSEEVDLSSTSELIPTTQLESLPEFPADVLLELSSEYASIMDGSSQKSPQYNGVDVRTLSELEYLELRLLDLYPEKAYKGMAKDAEAEAVKIKAESADKVAAEANSKTVAIVKENSEDYNFKSVDEEIELLQMTPDETANYKRLMTLGTAKTYAGLNEIAKFDATQNRSVVGAAAAISISCVPLVGVYAYYRATLCEERALNKANAYYPGYTSGMKGDAFKHIYVSMMLRRYLTELSAYAIMDLYWENQSSYNPYCDRYMDLHNNYVGRHAKYSTFRGSLLGDLNKWEKWGERVRDYVNADANKALMTWNANTDKATVEAQEKAANDTKYIIYTDK